jgi:hypothetical protein
MFSDTLQHTLNTLYNTILNSLASNPVWGEIDPSRVQTNKSFCFFFEQTQYILPIWDEKSQDCMNELQLKETNVNEIKGWLYFVTANVIAGFFTDISIHLQRRIGCTPNEFTFQKSILQTAKLSQIKWPQFSSKHRSTFALIEQRTLLLVGKLDSFKVQHSSTTDDSLQELKREGALNITLDISRLEKRNNFVPIKRSKLNGKSTMDSRACFFSQDSFEADDVLNLGNILHKAIFYYNDCI